MADHHYYGATCFGWETGKSKEAVIRRLARDYDKRMGGLKAVVCEVQLPQQAHYTIRNYLPELITKEDGVHDSRKGERVPIRNLERLLILNKRGGTAPAPVE